MLDELAHLAHLHIILISFEKLGEGSKQLVNSITQHLSKAVKGRLCNYNHMEVAQGN